MARMVLVWERLPCLLGAPTYPIPTATSEPRWRRGSCASRGSRLFSIVSRERVSTPQLPDSPTTMLCTTQPLNQVAAVTLESRSWTWACHSAPTISGDAQAHDDGNSSDDSDFFDSLHIKSDWLFFHADLSRGGKAKSAPPGAMAGSTTTHDVLAYLVRAIVVEGLPPPTVQKLFFQGSQERVSPPVVSLLAKALWLSSNNARFRSARRGIDSSLLLFSKPTSGIIFRRSLQGTRASNSQRWTAIARSM
ncbi:hypothetical protein GE09DRAFT_283398 [Coniochaeta sp. 2T2.1]|nr:hypothetical protein GE09DRAFT_283398 [Coniochaeta sp. 2T2.1]